MIVLGTLLRGPNWNFFGPYEHWDAHKVEALVNIYLSDVFWHDLLNTTSPKAPPGSGTLTTIGYMLVREAPGILLVLGYFIALPPLLAVTVFRGFYQRMGFIRYMVHGELAFVHDVVADQDGFALDIQFEVFDYDTRSTF